LISGAPDLDNYAGEYSIITPTEMGQAMVDTLGADAALTQVPAAAHYRMADNPAVFGEGVRQLIDRL